MARVRYLLDTNVLSEPVAARPNPFVLDRIKANGTSLAISSVTWQEVLYGMFLLPAGKRRDQIEDYLFRRIRPALPIVGFEEHAARWQAEQRALKETAARQKRSIASIIEESLRLRGIQDQASARSLVDQARARSGLDADAALSLAVEETRVARGQ